MSVVPVIRTVTATSAITSLVPAGGSVAAPEALTQIRTVLPAGAPAMTRTWPERAVPFGAVHRARAHVVCTEEYGVSRP